MFTSLTRAIRYSTRWSVALAVIARWCGSLRWNVTKSRPMDTQKTFLSRPMWREHSALLFLWAFSGFPWTCVQCATLSWLPSEGATGYRVYQSVGTNVFTNIAGLAGTNLPVDLAANSLTRFYVTGTNAVGESPPSETVSTNTSTPGLLVITAPTLLSGTNAYWRGVTVTATATVLNRTGAPFDVYSGVLTARQPGASNATGPFDDFAPAVTPQTLAVGQGLTLTASWGVRSDATNGTWTVYCTIKGTNGWVDGPSTTFQVVDPPGPATPPPAPTGLRLTQLQGTRYDLTWMSSLTNSSRVERAPANGSFTTLAMVVAGTLHYTTQIKKNDHWKFQVRSCDTLQCSAPSNVVPYP